MGNIGSPRGLGKVLVQKALFVLFYMCIFTVSRETFF